MQRYKTPGNREDKIKHMVNQWKAFPNIGVLASYEPFSQIIHLNSITPIEFERAFKDRVYESRRKVVPLYFHELTHWVDHVTTLWGFEFLIKQFDAINARLGENVNEMWRIVEWNKTVRRNYYGDYYSITYAAGLEPSDGQPWAWELTAGAIFDSKGIPNEKDPIAFTKFKNRAGADLCRVPFSISSLLEANAMAIEMGFEMRLIDELTGNDKVVEFALFKAKSIKTIYDPMLANYSAAAHLLANVTGVSDIFSAYKFASRMAGFCLNFPRQLFDNLRIPESFAAWGNRNDAFKAQCDRGYLYMLLLAHARGLDFSDYDAWFTSILERSGLPGIEEIRVRADEEIKVLVKSHIPGKASDRLSQLVTIGRKYQIKNGLRLNSEYVDFPKIVPPILFSGAIIRRGQNIVDSDGFTDPSDWIDDAFRYSNLISEFLDACMP